MYKQQLCLALNGNFGIPVEEQIGLFKQSGFDGFAIDISDRSKNASELVAIGKKENMLISYLHAPFDKSYDMWHGGESGDKAAAELIECIELCAELEIPTAVAHTFIGFGCTKTPTAAGIERYGAAARRADELGVKLALENTEGEEYLATLMDALKSEKSVGFCWDTGHELCYNRGKDMTALYGERMIVTHLNDNLGIKDFSGEITYIDDLHLLPFDGITDWNSVARRLAKHHFSGPLTFELNTTSKPGRHENDCYGAMPIELYIAEAFKRACRVAALFIKAREEFQNEQ